MYSPLYTLPWSQRESVRWAPSNKERGINSGILLKPYKVRETHNKKLELCQKITATNLFVSSNFIYNVTYRNRTYIKVLIQAGSFCYIVEIFGMLKRNNPSVCLWLNTSIDLISQQVLHLYFWSLIHPHGIFIPCLQLLLQIDLKISQGFSRVPQRRASGFRSFNFPSKHLKWWLLQEKKDKVTWIFHWHW